MSKWVMRVVLFILLVILNTEFQALLRKMGVVSWETSSIIISSLIIAGLIWILSVRKGRW